VFIGDLEQTNYSVPDGAGNDIIEEIIDNLVDNLGRCAQSVTRFQALSPLHLQKTATTKGAERIGLE